MQDIDYGKTCSACATSRPLDEFHKDRSKADGRYTVCKICTRQKDRARYPVRRDGMRARSRAYYEKNDHVIRARSAAWHRNHPEQKAEQTRRWYALNPDRGREIKRKWQRENTAYRNESAARRRHGKRVAIPIWADRKAMTAIYAEARRKTAETGVKHHVDHIVPIKSPLVCGLHVEHNLRVVPWLENVLKHNRWWPDMPGGENGLV